MKIKLMRNVEHWRESGVVQTIIDEAETSHVAESYDEYDPLIEEFSQRVAAAIEDAGYTVEWVYRQSRGLGVVLQNSQGEAAWEAAVAECAESLRKSVILFARSE